ncbi:MAG: carboxypeptidase-like regulatory domain-containing protein, partial [Chitinophagales bacterium]
MSHKFFVFIIILSCIPGFIFGQNKKTAIVKGKLINSVTQAPFSDLKVTIPALNAFTTSDGEGNFEISEVPYGKQTIIITAYNATSTTINVVVDKDVVDMKNINITPNDSGASPGSNEIPTIALEDNNNT